MRTPDIQRARCVCVSCYYLAAVIIAHQPASWRFTLHRLSHLHSLSMYLLFHPQSFVSALSPSSSHLITPCTLSSPFEFHLLPLSLACCSSLPAPSLSLFSSSEFVIFHLPLPPSSLSSLPALIPFIMSAVALWWRLQAQRGRMKKTRGCEDDLTEAWNLSARICLPPDARGRFTSSFFVPYSCHSFTLVRYEEPEGKMTGVCQCDCKRWPVYVVAGKGCVFFT